MAGPLNSVVLEEGAILIIREWVGPICMEKLCVEEGASFSEVNHNIIRLVNMRDSAGEYFIALEVGDEGLGVYEGTRKKDLVSSITQRRELADEIKKGPEGKYGIELMCGGRFVLRTP